MFEKLIKENAKYMVQNPPWIKRAAFSLENYPFVIKSAVPDSYPSTNIMNAVLAYKDNGSISPEDADRMLVACCIGQGLTKVITNRIYDFAYNPCTYVTYNNSSHSYKNIGMFLMYYHLKVNRPDDFERIKPMFDKVQLIGLKKHVKDKKHKGPMTYSDFYEYVIPTYEIVFESIKPYVIPESELDKTADVFINRKTGELFDTDDFQVVHNITTRAGWMNNPRRNKLEYSIRCTSDIYHCIKLDMVSEPYLLCKRMNDALLKNPIVLSYNKYMFGDRSTEWKQIISQYGYLLGYHSMYLYLGDDFFSNYKKVRKYFKSKSCSLKSNNKVFTKKKNFEYHISPVGSFDLMESSKIRTANILATLVKRLNKDHAIASGEIKISQSIFRYQSERSAVKEDYLGRLLSSTYIAENVDKAVELLTNYDPSDTESKLNVSNGSGTFKIQSDDFKVYRLLTLLGLKCEKVGIHVKDYKEIMEILEL